MAVGARSVRLAVARGDPGAGRRLDGSATAAVLDRIRCGRPGPGLALAGVARHWVAGYLSGRLFAVADGVLVCGLQAGQARPDVHDVHVHRDGLVRRQSEPPPIVRLREAGAPSPLKKRTSTDRDEAPRPAYGRTGRDGPAGDGGATAAVPGNR